MAVLSKDGGNFDWADNLVGANVLPKCTVEMIQGARHPLRLASGTVSSLNFTITALGASIGMIDLSSPFYPHCKRTKK